MGVWSGIIFLAFVIFFLVMGFLVAGSWGLK